MSFFISVLLLLFLFNVRAKKKVGGISIHLKTLKNIETSRQLKTTLRQGKFVALKNIETT